MLLMRSFKNQITIQEIAMPAVEGANGGVVLDTISCNLPGNTTCVIIGHEIVLGIERPVSFVSFNGGASYKQNKNFVLSRITSTSFAHSTPRPS